MKPGKASWTAEITAVFRAAESLRPPGERLLFDPYAAQFPRPSFRLLLKSRRITEAVLRLAIERRFPGARITAVSRIRFVDDRLEACIRDGVRQVVLLGAGYDARAYRFPGLKSARIFETDHPETGRRKKRVLRRIFGSLPGNVAFVPVDFETDDLFSRLAAAGWTTEEKTLFIWEAVCKYLTPEAAAALLSGVSQHARAGSAIVFDYLFRSVIEGCSGHATADRAVAFQVRKGEPFLFGLPEEDPAKPLRELGFSKIENFPAKTICSMIPGLSGRAACFHPFWGVIHATV